MEHSLRYGVAPFFRLQSRSPAAAVLRENGLEPGVTRKEHNSA